MRTDAIADPSLFSLHSSSPRMHQHDTTLRTTCLSSGITDSNHHCSFSSRKNVLAMFSAMRSTSEFLTSERRKCPRCVTAEPQVATSFRSILCIGGQYCIVAVAPLPLQAMQSFVSFLSPNHSHSPRSANPSKHLIRLLSRCCCCLVVVDNPLAWSSDTALHETSRKCPPALGLPKPDPKRRGHKLNDAQYGPDPCLRESAVLVLMFQQMDI